ncbi:DUF4255 domain-containing protein [Chlorobaculum thiosulfatiphilum]|uniref:DUF4255 domain-containing protein n=1 Tax=Chlorobaculum thiosulfatiphilum TaxID=115852 RepID=A0A5C4SAS8_CHLTI|nr:DUF4255 domain-containing protein [Chlorobaculum thiosulfatiphilum]TNJ40382.1 DUF4255 domain-containing protein [Chlorobaculum thiosulfatiphilum]
MISHALTIVVNELNSHLKEIYAMDTEVARPGNPSDGFDTSNNASSRDSVIFSVINIREEKTLKNQPNFRRDETTLKALYENPPVFLNFQILIIAPHANYSNGLLMLSRVLRFFQYRNVFTQDNVSPASITSNAPTNDLDCLESFKLIFDLHSPSMEEINHLWGTLGGKQYPFVIYWMRMLDLKFLGRPKEGSLVREVVTKISHKP